PLRKALRSLSSDLGPRSSDYFAGFCFFFASARRSVFLRRAARFLTLSLPWLCPIRPYLYAAFFVFLPAVISGNGTTCGGVFPFWPKVDSKVSLPLAISVSAMSA